MNKLLKTGGVVAGVGLALCAGLVGYGWSLDTRWHVESSRLVAAPPSAVHALLDDLTRYPEWITGDMPEGQVYEVEYGARTSGPGASYAWEMPGSMGEFTLVSSDPARGITYEMVMERARTPAQGSITLEPLDGGTRVVWVDEGDLGMRPVGGLLVSTVESTLGSHFDIALAKLGALAEASAQEQVDGDARSAGEDDGDAADEGQQGHEDAGHQHQ